MNKSDSDDTKKVATFSGELTDDTRTVMTKKGRQSVLRRRQMLVRQRTVPTRWTIRIHGHVYKFVTCVYYDKRKAIDISKRLAL